MLSVRNNRKGTIFILKVSYFHTVIIRGLTLLMAYDRLLFQPDISNNNVHLTFSGVQVMNHVGEGHLKFSGILQQYGSFFEKMIHGQFLC